jgi:hypothetical protein
MSLGFTDTTIVCLIAMRLNSAWTRLSVPTITLIFKETLKLLEQKQITYSYINSQPILSNESDCDSQNQKHGQVVSEAATTSFVIRLSLFWHFFIVGLLLLHWGFPCLLFFWLCVNKTDWQDLFKLRVGMSKHNCSFKVTIDIGRY